MKRLLTITTLLLLAAMQGLAQSYHNNKITPDLLEEIYGSSKSNEMFQTIIVLNEQFDVQKSARDLQCLNKAQKKQYVIEELKTISKNSQKKVLDDLQQGQKADLVEDIQNFWIINAIGCSMTKDMVYAIAERPDVKFVTKNTEISITDGNENEVFFEDVILEKDAPVNQWNVTKVNADQVWNLGYTGEGIIVAVIDTGVNYNHTDIANNMWDGGTEYPNHGWDFVNNDNDPMDDNSHGTHCAGTVSSYGTNGKQCGIAKDAHIMALKVLNAKGQGNDYDIMSAIQFAVSHGADILSMSLSGNMGGFWSYRITMENVLHCGVIVSASAGNKGDNLTEFPIPNNVGCPGNCPSPWRHPDQTLDGGHSAVIAVGSTTDNDKHASSSSLGPSTWAAGDYIGFYNDYPWTEGDPFNIGLIKPDISAPGSSIVSLLYSSNTGYTSKSGTSMAAPCVAGVMALMLQANPALTPVEIDSIIETTAVQIQEQTSKNNTVGAGRIDALAILNYMLNACAAPTNLTATKNEAIVSLYWTAAENVSSYRIYRNGTMIANNVTDNTYTDINVPAGSNTYFVRSNGANYQASLPSNQVTIYINTNTEINAPEHLIATQFDTNSGTVTLNWDAKAPRTDTLCYVSSKTGYMGSSGEFIAAQRFPSSMLQPYAGMQIEHIYFSLKNAESTCIINLYEGDEMLTGTKVFEGNFTTTAQEQQVDCFLNEFVAINPEKDLWLTITTSDKIAYSIYEGQDGNVLMYRYPDDEYWISNYGKAWAFQLGLGENYTYNVYHNDIPVSSSQSAVNYSGSYDNGLNKYQVTAVTNNYESLSSNSIYVVSNTANLINFSLNTDDKLFILPNSTLTITESLINALAENLILEDGAQLIHNSVNVQATVKKSIDAHDTDDGWNFIASPIASSITPSEIIGLLANDYDLYRFTENPNVNPSTGIGKEWENYRIHQDDFNIDNGQGYLYANSDDVTLTFAGTIYPCSQNISKTLEYHSDAQKAGWNLVGNPFTCTATISDGNGNPKPFYVISGNTIVANTSTTIMPCIGVMVKADGENEAITFTKASNQPQQTSQLQMTLSHNSVNRDGTPTVSETVDNAIVCFDQVTELEKFVFNTDLAKIYIPQNGNDYAVVSSVDKSEIPVNFSAAEDGSYTLSIKPEGVELGYLHLIDNLTGNDVDLLVTPSYTFEAKPSDYATRFKLVFDNNGSSTDSETFAYISDGNIIVTDGPSTGSGTCATLQIVDMMGRVVVEGDAMNRVSTSEMAHGVYVLRLINGEKVKTQKIVIE